MTEGLSFDHLGVIVADLADGRAFLQNTLGITRWTAVTDDPGLHVSVQFGSAPSGGPVYELITPLGDGSPIANALRQGKHILNHVAYLTADLDLAANIFASRAVIPPGRRSLP